MKHYALALILLGPCDRFVGSHRPDAASPAVAPAPPSPSPITPSTVPTTPPAPAPATHAAAPAPAAGANPGGPRLGKYNLLSYGAGAAPLYLGRIDLLPGGRYGAANTSTGAYYGQGTYSFDAAGSKVVWLSGPMHDQGWTGTFTIEREGKTHKIRVRPTTIATNSTDAP